MQQKKLGWITASLLTPLAADSAFEPATVA